MFNWFFFQSVVLMFLYVVEQDVNLAWQSCSGRKNWKRKKKNVEIWEKIVLESGWTGLKDNMSYYVIILVSSKEKI